MNEFFKQLIHALAEQIEQLKKSPREIQLFNGELIGLFAGFSYYRFEIPEDIMTRTTERVTFTFGQQQPVNVKGNIIALENQYLTVALPLNFGPSLPEVKCSWNFEEEQKPIIDLLDSMDEKALIPPLMFQPADQRNRHIVSYSVNSVPDAYPEQIELIKKIFNNRITMLWGPIHTGKTEVLALTVANYIKAGRKVLFVAPTNDIIDSMLLKTAEYTGQLGMDAVRMLARVDLPTPRDFDIMTKYSFEQQVENLKQEKRKVFQERTSLLDIYWRTKIKQILHEDFYNRILEKRERLADLRKQIDQVSRTISQLNQTITELENASLMDKIKKGFSKNEITSANEQLSRQQLLHKRLMSTQQIVSNEITENELEAPVPASELKEFKEALKKIDELGGLEKVIKAVEDFTAADELGLLKSKLFIATGVNAAIVDPAVRNQQYDLVIVNEAQRINIPTLAALSTLAREKFIIAGDPFELEPESAPSVVRPNQWLMRDIFMQVAGTSELHDLFAWSEKNSQWSILLKSQYSKTPRISGFAASVLFNSRIGVQTLPGTNDNIYFIDTSALRSLCKQYSGRRESFVFNELHTKQVIECVKHALMEPFRRSSDIGIILPLTGPTLFTKLQLRIQGIRNIEVGTPQSFCNRPKKAVIFDTTMAGVDYTIDAIDDKKTGSHRIARLFNTVFSCVEEDLYVIADMSHFKFLYPDRLITRFLTLLQAQAGGQPPSFAAEVRKFDEMDLKEREEMFSLFQKESDEAKMFSLERSKTITDLELEIQMKKMVKLSASKPVVSTGNELEREVSAAVQRVLGWRTDLNLLSQFAGGDILFRNSYSTYEAASQLPLDTCENEKQFQNIMEKWNLLIYEMSGGYKADISFFTSKGPEGRVRQDIRNLHAFYSSDVEAAIEEGKKKIAVEVARVFQELLGKSKPDNPADWRTAYLNFLKRLEGYLSWISEQIRK